MSSTHAMSALRRDVARQEADAVAKKQQALTLKHDQLNQFGKVHEAHRADLLNAENVKRLNVQHLRNQHSDAKEALLHSKSEAATDRELAQRRLGEADKRAREAKMEETAWKSKAAAMASKAEESAARADEHLASVQGHAKKRIEEAHTNAQNRVSIGKALVEETVVECERWKEKCQEQRSSAEKTAQQMMELNSNRADVVRHHAALRVRTAVDKSHAAQKVAVQEMAKSRDDMSATQRAAKQSIEEMRRQCELAIETETQCSEQALRMAQELCKATEEHCEVKIDEKKKALSFSEQRRQLKCSNFDEEKELATNRNASWLTKDICEVEMADQRANVEAKHGEAKVQRAKETLEKMEAKCAAYVQDVMRQWEAAKQVDAQRVKDAQARAAELAQYAEKTLKECEERCAKLLVEAQKEADAKKDHSEQRVKAITSMADHRVQMTHEQSAGRRALAEKRLADMQKYLDDLRRQTGERKNDEKETADQKIHLARQRLAEEVAKAEIRAQDAEACRDKAAAENDAVKRRVLGATQELRAGGLHSVARIMEGELPEDLPPAPPPRPPPPVAEPEVVQEAEIAEQAPADVPEAPAAEEPAIASDAPPLADDAAPAAGYPAGGDAEAANTEAPPEAPPSRGPSPPSRGPSPSKELKGDPEMQATGSTAVPED